MSRLAFSKGLFFAGLAVLTIDLLLLMAVATLMVAGIIPFDSPPAWAGLILMAAIWMIIIAGLVSADHILRDLWS